MSRMAVGLRSLSLHFPTIERTNEFFRTRSAALMSQQAQKTLARAFAPTPASGADPWTEEMRPYLADPFRGTVARRVLGPTETSLTLEQGAAQSALTAAGLQAEDVDLLIVSSLFPEHEGPGNAPYLAAQLGLRCGAWNLESMCVGPLVALQNAAALVRAGDHRNVLVVTSCTYSRMPEEDDTLGFFMGDGAAAMIVAASEGGGEVLATRLLHTGETLGIFYCALAEGPGGPRRVVRGADDAARRIQATITSYIGPCCESLLAAAGAGLGDVDFFLFNTPTAWYERVFCRALGVSPERTLSVYPRYGNVGTVLPLANLYHAAAGGRIRPGDLVLVFGMGYSSNAIAVLLRWGHTALGPPPAPPAEVQ